MIYLDNAATTQMFEGGVDIYKKYACQSFFNPSAGYSQSIEIAKELNVARDKILNKLGASKGNIIFTGGATESNNLAIMGSKRNGKWEYVFSVGEHPSVYNVARELESQGFIVHFVGLQENGQIDYNQLEKVLNSKTRLISVIHSSNETGAVNDLQLVDKIRKDKSPQALLHVDGVQAFCKLEYRIDDYNIDLYTISAHKFHGPKGVGALYVRNCASLKNIVFGGGQENGYRSGTENVPGIMSMVYAIENIDVRQNYMHVKELNKKLKEIFSKDENISYVNGNNPYVISFGFAGVNGETLMRALENEGIIVGTGSACSAKKAGNRILENCGLSKDKVKTHIRISFDFNQTIDQIEEAGEIILKTYHNLLEKVK